jgi:hypothetical protein
MMAGMAPPPPPPHHPHHPHQPGAGMMMAPHPQHAIHPQMMSPYMSPATIPSNPNAMNDPTQQMNGAIVSSMPMAHPHHPHHPHPHHPMAIHQAAQTHTMIMNNNGGVPVGGTPNTNNGSGSTNPNDISSTNVAGTDSNNSNDN